MIPSTPTQTTSEEIGIYSQILRLLYLWSASITKLIRTHAELRLVGGTNRCEGRLELRPSGSVRFGQACDNDVGRNEAKTICRQLNCDTEGARTAGALE